LSGLLITNWTKKGQTPLSRDRPLSPFLTVYFGPDSKFGFRTTDRIKENRSGKCGPRTELNKSWLELQNMDRTKTFGSRTGPTKNLDLKIGPSIGLKNLEKNWTMDWTTGHTWSFRTGGPGNYDRACRSRGEISVKYFRGLSDIIELLYSFLLGWDMSLSGCDDILD